MHGCEVEVVGGVTTGEIHKVKLLIGLFCSQVMQNMLHVVARASYLDLPVITDGFDGYCGSQHALCTAGPELNYSLGPTHEARQCALVLNQLLLLLLQNNKTKTVRNFYFICFFIERVKIETITIVNSQFYTKSDIK